MWFDLLPFLLSYALDQWSHAVSLWHVIHSQIFLSFGLHWAGEHRVHVPRTHTCINHPGWGWLLWLPLENPHWELFPWLSEPALCRFNPITSTAKKGKSVPGKDWAGLATWGTEWAASHTLSRRASLPVPTNTWATISGCGDPPRFMLSTGCIVFPTASWLVRQA